MKGLVFGRGCDKMRAEETAASSCPAYGDFLTGRLSQTGDRLDKRGETA